MDGSRARATPDRQEGELALAKALNQSGTATDVVERAADGSQTGGGLYLPANALRALCRRGLAPAVVDRANWIRRQRIPDHRGRLLVDIDVDGIWDGVGESLAIGRAELHEALRQEVAGVSIRRAKTVVGLENSIISRATLSDGSTAAYARAHKVSVGSKRTAGGRRHAAASGSGPIRCGGRTS